MSTLGDNWAETHYLLPTRLDHLTFSSCHRTAAPPLANTTHPKNGEGEGLMQRLQHAQHKTRLSQYAPQLPRGTNADLQWLIRLHWEVRAPQLAATVSAVPE